MHVTLYEAGIRYVVEAPAGARVNRLPSGDCLIYDHDGERQYIITPIVVTVARRGERGLRLVSESAVPVETKHKSV